MTRLYRNRTEKMVGGVCAGLGDYLRLDPAWIRLFFILLTLGNGIGVLLYGVLWLILPENTDQPRTRGALGNRIRTEIDDLTRDEHPQARYFLGGTLIALGLIFLLQNLNLPWLWWFNLDMLWPLLLIAGGVVFLLRALQGETNG